MTAQKRLDRESVVASLYEYVLEANFRGYAPLYSKVLAVEARGRPASLREAGIRARWEAFYFIEGELFPEPFATRLPEWGTVRGHAEKLAESVWEKLSLWTGYDFTTTTYGLGRLVFVSEDMERDPSQKGKFGGTYAPV